MIDTAAAALRSGIPGALLPLLDLRTLIGSPEQRAEALALGEVVIAASRAGLPAEVEHAMPSILLAEQPSLELASRRLAAFDRLVESVLLYE
ncbi:MAG: hypothetical protein AAF628_19485 [Planctomycetota bacterium]